MVRPMMWLVVLLLLICGLSNTSIPLCVHRYLFVRHAKLLYVWFKVCLGCSRSCCYEFVRGLGQMCL